MELANDAIYQTHYNILNVNEDASHEEIRSSYKAALLTSHPDKLQHTSQTDADHNETRTRFLEIQTAWEILGDVKSRALYDMDLRLSRQEDDVIEDEVELENMTVEASGDLVELLYQCRCGDYFSVDSLELGEMGFQLSTENNKISLQGHNGPDMASVVLPCGSCSLKIRLIVNSCPHP